MLEHVYSSITHCLNILFVYFATYTCRIDYVFRSQTTGLCSVHGISFHTPEYPVDATTHFSIGELGSAVNQFV